MIRRRFKVTHTLAGVDLLLHRIGWSVQVREEPCTGWHLGNFPGPSRTWRSFNACVHLIREEERIGAG